MFGQLAGALHTVHGSLHKLQGRHVLYSQAYLQVSEGYGVPQKAVPERPLRHECRLVAAHTGQVVALELNVGEQVQSITICTHTHNTGGELPATEEGDACWGPHGAKRAGWHTAACSST